MTHYGIIGKPLEHSFSAMYFTQKFEREHIDADYCLYALDDLGDIARLMQYLHGFNVTYPYKEQILPYLHGVDAVAQRIGAVNVVCQGRGYNTDWLGFMQSIQPYLLPSDQCVLLLGTGGVSKAVQYALQEMQLRYTCVSRHPGEHQLAYHQLTREVMEQHTVIVNCTQLGMLPEVDTCPSIPYEYITPAHLLYDCVYNPERTLFLQNGQRQGARILNGKQMLYLQADAAYEIWNKIKNN